MSGDVSQSDWDASGYHSISYISLVNLNSIDRLPGE